MAVVAMPDTPFIVGTLAEADLKVLVEFAGIYLKVAYL